MSAWYRTGRNPWERSRLSHQSGVGLDTEKTACELLDCYEEQGGISATRSALCTQMVSPLLAFPKEQLELEPEFLCYHKTKTQ